MSSSTKPNYQLTVENDSINFLSWKRSWQLCLGCYGTAGEEILNNQLNARIHVAEPMVQQFVLDEVNVNGVIQIVQRGWNAEDRKQLPARKAEWAAMQEKYKKSRGQLMAAILETIDQNLATDLENQPQYDEIIRANDHLGLWRLVGHVVAMKGGSQVNLVTKWRNLRQDTNTLAAHIKQFERLLANIDGAVQPISPREKAEQLVRSIDHSKYNVVFGPFYHLLEVPVPAGVIDPFPTYDDLKNRLIKYDASFKRDIKMEVDTSAMFAETTGIENRRCYRCGKHGHLVKDCKVKPYRNLAKVWDDGKIQPTMKQETSNFKMLKVKPYSSTSSNTRRTMKPVFKSSKMTLSKPTFENQKSNVKKKVKRIFFVEASDEEQNNQEAEASEQSEEESVHDSDYNPEQ